MLAAGKIGSDAQPTDCRYSRRRPACSAERDSSSPDARRQIVARNTGIARLFRAAAIKHGIEFAESVPTGLSTPTLTLTWKVTPSPSICSTRARRYSAFPS
jgi:hypothetical protein